MKITRIATTVIISTTIILASLWWLNEVKPAGQLVLSVASENSQTLADDIRITIESIELHKPEAGWDTVLRPNTTASLGELDQQDQPTTFGTANLTPGSYDNIRLTFQATVIKDNSEIDVVLPNHSIVIPAQTRIGDSTTSSLTFTFRTNQTLYQPEKTTYIMLPHIGLESRYNVTINQTKENISISGGDLMARTDVSLNETGASQYGFFSEDIQSVDYDASEGIEVIHKDPTGTTSLNSKETGNQ